MSTEIARPATRISKVVTPGRTEWGGVYVYIRYADGRLSITGVEGPKSDGNARGSCGQCIDALNRLQGPAAAGWEPAMVQHLHAVWDRWHLNNMRAGCEHQRSGWDTERKLEVVEYGLTTEAYHARQDALRVAQVAGMKGERAELTPTARALAELEDWFRPRYSPPDADSPLSGCFEVKKREEKAAGWVKENEHPDGLLCRPCAVCGYKYGSAWLREEVPAEVLAWLEGLPEVAAPQGWPLQD